MESKPAEKSNEKTSGESAEKPLKKQPAGRIVAPVEGGYEIDFDITETPELKEW
jgi:hypothetical protein